MITKKHEKYLRQLKQKKYRSLCGEFIVEGMRLCEELIKSQFSIKEIYYSSDFLTTERAEKLLQNIKKKNITAIETSRSFLEKICTTKNPCSIIAWVEQQQHGLPITFSGSRYIILENVSDPGNIGTIIRTAEAFSWDALFLVDQSVEIYNPKLVRATMGSLFRFPIFHTTLPQLLSSFQDTGVSYVVTSIKNGCDPDNFKVPEKIALFLGNEAHGISDFWENNAHHYIKIPTDNVESLNIAIAGGILLFLYKKKVFAIK